MDVLVSFAVIAILMAILVPVFSKVNENARRVACQSNVRQMGTGLLMYAQMYSGELPPSDFVNDKMSGRNVATPAQPEDMIVARRSAPSPATGNSPWDGVGFLYTAEFIPAPKVFYCPSHTGSHTFTKYARDWGNSTEGEIVTNYQYRGKGPMGLPKNGQAKPTMVTNLYYIDPGTTSLLADGMRSPADFNHKVGANFFRADLTVHWFSDPGQTLLTSLTRMDGADAGQSSSAAVFSAWTAFDTASATGAGQ